MAIESPFRCTGAMSQSHQPETFLRHCLLCNVEVTHFEPFDKEFSVLDENAIQEAASRLANAVCQPACIILFASYARGSAVEAFDLDLLIVEESLDDKAGKYMRLRNALGGLTTGVDLLLLSRRDFERRRQVKGMMPHRAHHEGRVLYDTTA